MKLLRAKDFDMIGIRGRGCRVMILTCIFPPSITPDMALV